MQRSEEILGREDISVATILAPEHCEAHDD
jgi:hypothetical protein